MDPLIIFLFGGIFFLFLAYFLFDVNYFIRFLYTIFLGKFIRTRMKFFDSSVKYGIVFFPDVDHYLTHMNNARAVREFDFGRMDYITRTGLLELIVAKKGGGVVAAQTIRYRRPLHLFATYKIITTPAYYDTKSIYFEQKIVTLADGITRVIAYVKLTFNSGFNLEKIVSKHFPRTVKPPLPKDLEHWIEFNELSSVRLKSRRASRMKPNEQDTLPQEEDASENTTCLNEENTQNQS